MKTYFVCSDIHGFYYEWRRCLKSAGYDHDNPEHILIVLGDIFDRGEHPLAVYRFLRNLPVERRILVRGNHEALLSELYYRGFELSHDLSNGTYATLMQLSGVGLNPIETYSKKHPLPPDHNDYMQYLEARGDYLDRLMERLYRSKRVEEILNWIDSDEWRDYYETEHYIFVHSFIPIRVGGFLKDYDPHWREASRKAFIDASWVCPFEMYLGGYFDPEIKKGKTLVCGHWHTADFYNHLDYRHQRDRWLDYEKENPIYRSERYPNLIGIDACTAATKVVNILVLKENEL